MVAYNLERVGEFLPQVLAGLPMTLWLLFLTTLLGALLGGLLAWAQLGTSSLGSRIAKGYIFVLRCTPPIVLLFLVFYGLPAFLQWWLGLDIDRWPRAVFALLTMLLLFGALVAEVFKAAYLAVPRGQTEAGLSIGLTPSQTFWRIVFPQAFKIALPNLTTAILNLMRDAALAYTIGLVDVMGAGNLLISRNLGNYSLETYTAVALVYWLIALVISLASKFLERQLTIKER